MKMIKRNKKYFFACSQCQQFLPSHHRYWSICQQCSEDKCTRCIKYYKEYGKELCSKCYFILERKENEVVAEEKSTYTAKKGIGQFWRLIFSPKS